MGDSSPMTPDQRMALPSSGLRRPKELRPLVNPPE